MKKCIKIGLFLILFFTLLITSTGITLWYLWSSNLPYIGSLKNYNPPIITKVFADDGQIIGKFADEKRVLVTLDKIPTHTINAFIAAEDARFFQHKGIDFLGIVRALFKNIKARRIEQGGSTITQQVTKSLLLKNPARTYKRKVREALLSLQIEKEFSKNKILYLYLNQIYMGHGLYGIEAASELYFGKHIRELNIAESALLAGLARAPSRDDPIKHFNRAKLRQKYVLERMKDEGFINDEQFQQALKRKLTIKSEKAQYPKKAPYFLEHIRQRIERKYGRHLLYKGGLKVYTTVNLKMQEAAQKAIKRGLYELDKREGFRSPTRRFLFSGEETLNKSKPKILSKNTLEIGTITQGTVIKVDSKNKETLVQIEDKKGILPLSNMKWARMVDPEKAYFESKLQDPADVLTPGDIITVKIVKKSKDSSELILSLEQTPEAQAALICLEAKTGYVKAMVGGLDFSKSQFNRATQARRQPGSAFKPIIYAAALDNGLTPSSIIIDAPFISPIGEEEKPWKPKNYKEKFYGPTPLRTGLIKSRNIMTIKILKKIGVKRAIDYARRMGIDSHLNADLSLALGSSGVSLVELTKAYSVFANGGMRVKPTYISKIIDRTALSRPVAGKTGTTNDLKDAWFIGFDPTLVTGVWVGYDDSRQMGKGETGSRAACPIWLYFMREVLKGKPIIPFQQPEGVVIAKIDARTGLLASPFSQKTCFEGVVIAKIDARTGLLASPFSQKTCFQAFKKGTEPTRLENLGNSFNLIWTTLIKINTFL